MSKFIKIIDNQSLCMQPLIEKVIKKLWSLPNGGDCTMIYLKILELAIDNNGALYFHKLANTFEEELSLILSENVENIKNVLSVLFEMDLISENAPNTFIISDFEKFSNDLRKKCKNNYDRNYRRQKRSNDNANAHANAYANVHANVHANATTNVITSNNSVITNDKKQQSPQPAQTSDTSKIQGHDNDENNKVSTNTRTCAQAHARSGKDLYKDLFRSNKDLKDLKDQDLKDLNKTTHNKDLKRHKDLEDPKDKREIYKKPYKTTHNNKDLIHNKDLEPKNPLCVCNNPDIDLNAITEHAINHLNCVTGKYFRPIKQYRDLIIDLLNNGYTPQDFITVIDKKKADLEASNPKGEQEYWIEKLINPTWLFNPKNFDRCLNLRVVRKQNTNNAKETFGDFMEFALDREKRIQKLREQANNPKTEGAY